MDLANLEAATPAEEIDKTHAMIVLEYLTDILKKEEIKILRIDKSSHKKWFITAIPSQNFVEKYYGKMYSLYA